MRYWKSFLKGLVKPLDRFEHRDLLKSEIKKGLIQMSTRYELKEGRTSKSQARRLNSDVIGDKVHSLHEMQRELNNRDKPSK